jgi:hypothetical protein
MMRGDNSSKKFVAAPAFKPYHPRLKGIYVPYFSLSSCFVHHKGFHGMNSSRNFVTISAIFLIN